MKIIHVTKSRHGGAGIAAERTVSALRSAGLDVELWTEGAPRSLGPRSSSLFCWLCDKMDSLPTRVHWRYRKFSSWSNNWQTTRKAKVLNRSGADLIHLHWIAQGFFSFGDLAMLNGPLVWTMHDAWAITGGCHYPGDCRRFRDGCGNCPQLGSLGDIDDLSRRNFRKKIDASKAISHWVMPSRWMREMAISGQLVRADDASVIHNPIDVSEWTPIEHSAARAELALPASAFVLAVGAMDLGEPRKGAGILNDFLTHIVARLGSDVILLAFGARENHLLRGQYSPLVRSFGRVGPALLRLIYSAADLLLLPSVQDNFPNIALEAHACGCPIVGFRSGGVAEMIIPELTGLLAEKQTSESLADTVLIWRHFGLSRTDLVRVCRDHTKQMFSPDAHAKRLISVYENIISGREKTRGH